MNVGIGTTSPAAILETVSATSGGAPVFRAGTADFLGAVIGTQGGGFAVESGNYFSIWHQPYADRGTQTNLTERLRIDTSGNVGIGTTSPAQKLDVQDGFIRVQSPDVGGVAPPILTIGQINNAYQAGITSSIHLSMKAANSAGNFYWYPNSNTPIMILNQAGNLGIGTIAPASKLDVIGDGKFRGTSESSAVLKLGQKENTS